MKPLCLDLFSGIGAMSMALRDYVETIAYCEIEPYCQSVLFSRMESNDLDNAPIWDDITTLTSECLPKDIEFICGGFPCQDISIGGSGSGLAGKRSGLFYEVLRLSKEIRPKFIFLENVAAIRTRGLSTIVKELSDLGYDSRWCSLSAYDVGSPQKRERWFLLANLKSRDVEEQTLLYKIGTQGKLRRSNSIIVPRNYWADCKRPAFGVDDGPANWKHRVKSLGNTVVPQQAKEAFERLMGLK